MAALKAGIARPKAQAAVQTPEPRPLPEPGSEEAKAAFRAACGETDRLALKARDGYPDLRGPNGATWTKHSLGRALSRDAIDPGRYAVLYRQAAEREHRIEAAAIASDIGALWALAFPEEAGRGIDDMLDEDDADAELIRLGRQFEVAAARETELGAIASAACDEALRHMPERPAALLFREDDSLFRLRRDRGVGVPPAGDEYEWRDIEALRGRTFTRRVERLVTPEDKLPSSAHTIVGGEPWPEAQARADEIVDAWDSWHAERHQARVEHGEIAADEAEDAARLVTQALVERIAAERATTAEGFRVKLRAMFLDQGGDDGRDQSIEARMQRSLRRDVGDDYAQSSERAERGEPSSDFAAACDAAVARLAWVNTNDDPDEAWPDERVTAENVAFDAVLDRAAVEPSHGPVDLAAKARLLLCEYRHNVGENAANAGERALSTLLREVAALDASTSSDTVLTGLTIRHLARLHETVAHLWQGASVFLNAPFAWDDRRENCGPLGRIIEREVDRLEKLASAVAREARGRTPQGDDERDERFGILVHHGMLGGGPLDDREIIAEVAQAWGA